MMLKTLKGGLRPSLPKPEKRTAIPKPPKPRVVKIEEEPELMVIQGRPAMSKEEYWVSKALELLGWKYTYQYVVGMLGVRGTQKLDFLVYTPGKWTVVDVRGRYWHSGGREGELDLERVVHKKNWRLVVVWDTDISDVGNAKVFLQNQIGGA